MRKMAVIVRAENDDPAALIPAIRRELAALDSTHPGRVRRLLGHRRCLAGSAPARSARARRVRPRVSDARGRRHVWPDLVLGHAALQRDRGAVGDCAERDNLLEDVVKGALQLAGIGVVIGIVGAIAMRQVVASQLYETSSLDPWVLVLVPVTMFAVTTVASYVPARRASRITSQPRCARTD